MYRIAIVTETWFPDINGVSRTIQRLVQGLIEEGVVVDLIRPRRPGESLGRCTDHRAHSRLTEFCVPGRSVPGYSQVRFGWPAWKRLRRLWLSHRPDIVQVVTEGPLGASAVTVARRLGIPLISDFHTRFDAYSTHYGAGLLRSLTLRYLRRLHNRTNLTLVPTGELLDELSAQGFESLAIVERGIDCRAFNPGFRSQTLRQRYGIGCDQLLVGLVSRLAAEKNLSLAIEAFDEIQRHQPSARLMMVGDGPESAHIAAARPDIILTGMQTGDQLARHYASMDLFLAPSVTETFGNIVLEAMASGLPVVTYDYAAGRLHIDAGANGILVPFDEAEAFVEAAVRLSLNPADMARLGQQAVRSVSSLDWQRIVQDLIRNMASLLNRSPSDEPIAAIE